jgi:hypothetical protein
MKRVWLGLGLLLAICIGGCDDLVVSLQPLATDGTLITDPCLAGKWVCDDQIWEFIPTDSKEYKLRVVELLSSSTFKASLVDIRGRRFLDIVPDDLTQGHPMGLVFAMHLVPAHGLFKIQVDHSSLSLKNLGRKGFQEMANADPGLLQYDTVNDRVVLTASTEQLQGFVVRHADANGLWEDMPNFVRGRPLYTRDQIVVDPDLAGRWSDPNVVLDVTAPGEDRLCHISGWVEDEVPLSVWAYLVQRDGVRLWAAFLDKPTFDTKNPQSDLIPDMLILVEQTGPQLRLQVAERKAMVRLMNRDPNEPVFDGSDVLTLTREGE